MDSLFADMESGIESELIDLGAVSMTALRKLDGTKLRQVLRHVMQQTAHPQVTASGSERYDSTDRHLHDTSAPAPTVLVVPVHR